MSWKPANVMDMVVRRTAMVGYANGRVIRASLRVTRKASVSVIIPCYNYGHYLRACVNSALAQPGVDVDVLIIDDASTDGSTEHVKAVAISDKRVRAICHERNKGHIATYNEGLAEATGEYVVLLSADDLLAPGSLARAVALMEAHPQVGLVYGLSVVFTDEPPPLNHHEARSWTIWRGRDWITDRCRTGRNPLRCPEAVMRTAVLRRVGNYKSNLPHTADMHMWMNAAAICDVGYVGGIPQGYYRVHSTNMHNANFNTSEPQGSIVDLRERLKCFVQMLADNPRVSGSKELLGTARRSLAREALRLAVRSYEWGTADQWPIEELVAFAAEISTPDDLRSLSRALARRQRLGVTRSRRYPPFVAVEQVYKLRSRLIMWRWRHAGI